MNYKKPAIVLAALLLLGSAASAEIALKDTGNGQVAITFTYKDDAASEMDVIGSFDNWTVPGEAMTKNGAGLWEKTITAASTDELTYKFYNKGTWIPDDKAPDQKDDGYGGHNGLIVVADILSGAVAAVSGAAAAPTAAAGPKKAAGRPKIYFGTETFVESDTSGTTGNGFDTQSSLLNSYSLWKVRGDLITGMPGHIDITVVNGKQALYTNGTTAPLDWGTGGQNLVSGALFAPFYYLSGNQRPSIDKFGFGIESPVVVYDSGYGNVPFPTHHSILWDTTTGAMLAGKGFSSFSLGKDLQDWGDFTVNASVTPSVSAGNYGLSAWTSAEAYGVKLEGQYDMFASTATDATRYFTDPKQQNLYLGAEGYIDAFFVQGQFLNSVYPDGTTASLYSSKERSAYKAVFGYRDTYGDTELKAGYAYRGAGAKLIFSNTADTNAVLGAVNYIRNETATQAITLNGHQNFGYWGVLKADGALVTKTGGPTSNVQLTARPGVVFNLDKLEIAPVETEFYAQVASNSQPASGIKTLNLDRVGAKASFGELVPGVVKGVDLYYMLNNQHTAQNGQETVYTTAELSSLLSEVHLAGDVFAQAGVGFRSGDQVASTTALVLGARYTLAVPEAKTPTVYAQFVYNMDPYNAANSPTSATDSTLPTVVAPFAGGPTHGLNAYDPGKYDLTDFGPTNGASAFDGQASLRVGISWNY